MIKKVYAYFVGNGKEDFVTEDVVEFLEKYPEVAALNYGIGRNEGLANSITNDGIISINGGI